MLDELQRPREPSSHFGMFVRSVVVANQVYVQMYWDIRLDVTQKAQKLLMTMVRLALCQDATVGNVERRKQVVVP